MIHHKAFAHASMHTHACTDSCTQETHLEAHTHMLHAFIPLKYVRTTDLLHKSSPWVPVQTRMPYLSVAPLFRFIGLFGGTLFPSKLVPWVEPGSESQYKWAQP